MSLRNKTCNSFVSLTLMALVSFCRSVDSNLWTQALAYFARKEENCRTQIMEVLSRILFSIGIH